MHFSTNPNLNRRQAIAVCASTLATLGLAACGGSSSDSSAAADSKDPKQLTFEQGKLTIATGDPAWEPWVIGDDPNSGKGFEAALAYALADKMGFSKDEVVWTRTSFDEACAPGDHNWDLNIQQVSISDDRKKAVDFSPAYFRATQSVVVPKDGKYAGAKSCKDLASANIAVMVGSTAGDYVKDAIKDGSDEGISIFDDNSIAAQAVTSGQCDALVTDTPEAVYMVESGQVDNAVVVGQIPGTEDPEGTGVTLKKDSPLTPFVTDAMNALIDDGTVKKLQDEWLADYTSNVPMLEK